MLIQYCSDLHLEFAENEDWLRAHQLDPAGDVLVLAGDVMPFTHIDKYAWFLDSVSKQYEAVYWVPGNHEYYGGYIDERSGSFKENIRQNVWLLNNETVQVGNVSLICSTLWSHISPVAEWDIAKGMADYRCIRKHGERFRPLHAHRLHRTCRSFVEQAIATVSGKALVVTNHVPTFYNYPEEYRGSTLNEAFATELYPFIESSGACAWIFGHHHVNVPDIKIGETKMRTAQLGYVMAGEHHHFNSKAVIEL